ncbi:Serine/Threonine kinase domain protein (macronuclear) [Tetrahymena thermophila SB210]|uniref:Serine/Threonine kinase domain protein n=1 Tax=Tetrahymena thermophila (strain SB210) TaxID=312017 RepID=I7LSY0_TETTS|nr:Serine/Threonine kinase domain protein [Tetrahymena thermophila SB210]EAR83826.2 Serine/Threonine kinase domain protein [Tetrahymena thermophila SB210]|eukprot:XP_001031489.2 Serine/Threonine kinase domain protein [Tetrahymena thermophila SB210]
MNNVNQMLNKVIVGSMGNYKLTQQLGNGSISVVFKAERQEDSKIFAVKYVSSFTFEGQRKNKYQQNELEISKKIMEIKSKNLIEIYEVIQEDSEDSYIIMEFCDMCDLFSFSLTFWINWQTAIEFGYQIACGINDLHRFNITHRDLKPENIFVSSHKNDETKKIEYNIKIGDFGLSKEGDIFTSTVGTPNYMGPETYQEGDKTKETDIWAFGAILFELIEKKQYFSSHSAAMIYNQIKNFQAYDKQRLTKIEDSDILERVNNLIQKCLNVKPQNRIQSEELVLEIQSILQLTKTLPQEKRHISLKIPTNDFLKNQNYFQSIYYEIQDEEMHKNGEKQQFENKFNKQFIKKVESELVENSPDNSNEIKNNYDSQNQIAESQKEQSSNSIFYDESKLISMSNSKQNRSQDMYLENVEFVFSKLLSNNSNQNTQEEQDQNQLLNSHEQICNFLQRHHEENFNGQNEENYQKNQSLRKNNQELDNFEQMNLQQLANASYKLIFSRQHNKNIVRIIKNINIVKIKSYKKTT